MGNIYGGSSLPLKAPRKGKSWLAPLPEVILVLSRVRIHPHFLFIYLVSGHLIRLTDGEFFRIFILK